MKAEGKLWVLFDSGNKKKSKTLTPVHAQALILNIKPRHFRMYFIWTPGWEQWQNLAEFLTSGQTYFASAPPEPDINPDMLLADATMKTQMPDVPQDKTQLIKEPEVYTPYTEIVAPESFQVPDYGYYYQEFKGDDLTLSGIPANHKVEIVVSKKDLGSPRDRRIAPRHEFKIEAILLTKKGTSFRSYSKNISTSGTLLEDEIPQDFFHRPFEMILFNKFEKDSRSNRVHLTGRIIGDLADPRRLMFVKQDDTTEKRLGKLIGDYMEQQARMKKSAG